MKYKKVKTPYKIIKTTIKKVKTLIEELKNGINLFYVFQQENRATFNKTYLILKDLYLRLSYSI